MSFIRVQASIVLIFLGLSAALLISMPQKASAQVIYACENPETGLLYVVAANGTCPPGWTLLSWPSAPAASSPPLFQGIMVDAKGKTVGRFVTPNLVVRQISGVWVQLPVADLAAGFQISTPYYDAITYWYQSVDCTGQAYFALSGGNNSVLALGIVAIVPPATQPSIYFAGTPARVLIIHSERNPDVNSCGYYYPPEGSPIDVGPAQSVPVSSLGLTLPFSVQ